MNVLLTSAGRRVSLVEIFKSSMKDLSLDGQVFTADMSPFVASAHASDAHFVVGPVLGPDYVKQLVEICLEQNITLIVPLIDTELMVLAEAQSEFERLGIRVVISHPKAISLCRDKEEFSAYLNNVGIRSPLTLDTERAIEFPVFLKPRDGSSSKGAHLVSSKRELNFYLESVPNCFVQELVEGREFTIDILLSDESKVLCIVPRLRQETRAGEISKGITVRDEELIAFARKLVAAIPGLRGCVTLQCIVDEGGSVFAIELNPRFGGGYPLSMAAGANYPREILARYFLGHNADVELSWEAGVMMLRYDQAFYTKD